MKLPYVIFSILAQCTLWLGMDKLLSKNRTPQELLALIGFSVCVAMVFHHLMPKDEP
jgi:hypothetical protein